MKNNDNALRVISCAMYYPTAINNDIITAEMYYYYYDYFTFSFMR